MSKESYQVFTAHKTQVILDSEQTLLHRNPIAADYEGVLKEYNEAEILIVEATK